MSQKSLSNDGVPAFRKELTPEFLAAARIPAQTTLVEALLGATEQIRDDILLPASKNLDAIAVTRKDTGDLRSADAKTFTIETDRQCEEAMEKALHRSFPDALLISEEKFGACSPEEKRRVLDEALSTDKMVILTDPLDATRDFRQGGDGYGTMLAVLRHGEISAAVAHRSTDYANIDGLGHTLTFEEGDGVRIDGKRHKPLSERVFPTDAVHLRGYAGFEFIDAMKKGGTNGYPDLAGRFDSISDLWTCTKLYEDLIKGQYHFMLVPPPTDIFDYPAGLALVKESGGVAKFLDGTPATFAEIVKRQAFEGAHDPKSVDNTLVFAVSDEVFRTVQKEIQQVMSPKRPAAGTKPSFPRAA